MPDYSDWIAGAALTFSVVAIGRKVVCRASHPQLDNHVKLRSPTPRIARGPDLPVRVEPHGHAG
jgi:hypothetical protein